MLRRNISRGLAAAVLSAALVTTGGLAAHAAEAPSAPAAASAAITLSSTDIPELTDADIDSAFAELEASTLPRTVTTTLGKRLTSFDLNGTVFTFESRLQAGTKGTGLLSATPDLGGGWDTRGLYISFSPLDQQALIAGGGAAIAAAICLIPAVGQVACAVAAVVVAVATVYVADHGICSNKRTLRVYPTTRTGRCV